MGTEIREVPPGDERLSAVYPVMHELREHLDEQEFSRLYATAHEDGYRIAALFDGEQCRACAGYRLLTNFVSGRHIYAHRFYFRERYWISAFHFARVPG